MEIISQLFVGILVVLFSVWFSQPAVFKSRIGNIMKRTRIIVGILALIGIVYLVQDNIRKAILIKSQKSEIDSNNIKSTNAKDSLKTKIDDLINENYLLRLNTKEKQSDQNQTTKIVSNNQSGGITSGTVNINQPTVNVNEAIKPELTISTPVKINDTTWKSKLLIKGKGALPYINWNIFIIFNTPIIKTESGEDNFGMFTIYSRDNLKPTEYFIGFKEFAPSMKYSVYLYAKDSIVVKNMFPLTIDESKIKYK